VLRFSRDGAESFDPGIERRHVMPEVMKEGRASPDHPDFEGDRRHHRYRDAAPPTESVA
jgi:hypothetical protein